MIFSKGGKMVKNEVELEKYLVSELKVTGRQLILMSDKIKKYDDIYNEFLYWLKNRSYDMPSPLIINGYTAKQISRLNPSFSGIGVYNFLITLREKPEQAKQYIESGFRTM